MNDRVINRAKLINSLVTAVGWWILLLFSLGSTSSKLIASDAVTIIDFIIPFVLTLVVIRSSRPYRYFRSIHSAEKSQRHFAPEAGPYEAITGPSMTSPTEPDTLASLMAELDEFSKDGAIVLVKIDGERSKNRFTVMIREGRMGDDYFRKDGDNLVGLLQEARSAYPDSP